MKQIRNLGDERQSAMCAYCGDRTTTRDHVPSRILLDEPYPENLPVVPACETCNQGFSQDEEYVACLIECAINGTADISKLTRRKIIRILSTKLSLTQRLNSAHFSEGFRVEEERIENVILKLGRGHSLYELNEPHFEQPESVEYAVISELSDEKLFAFENPPTPSLVPEVGSRGMQRFIVGLPYLEWVIVQPGRYRYLAFVDGRSIVRAVLSEFLAIQVIWN